MCHTYTQSAKSPPLQNISFQTTYMYANYVFTIWTSQKEIAWRRFIYSIIYTFYTHILHLSAFIKLVKSDYFEAVCRYMRMQQRNAAFPYNLQF